MEILRDLSPDNGLDSRVASLESIVNRTQQEPDSWKPQQFVVPFWDVMIAKGLTLTTGAGVNWDNLFDNTSATNQCSFNYATSGGEISTMIYWDQLQRRYRIAWDSDAGGAVKAYLMGCASYEIGTGTVQVNLNGTLTEYAFDPAGTTYYEITLDTMPGRNFMSICATPTPFNLQFYGRLFDGRTSRWVDPRDAHQYIRQYGV